MRVLHTSDWHLGRSFHQVQLLDAQVEVLNAMVEMVESEQIDVVVIAGDIYDRAVPGADAVRVLSELLARIRDAGAVVVGMAGNHDNATRLSWAEPVMSSAGVTLRGDLASIGRPVIVPQPSGDGAVAFYPIPYLEPELARHGLGVPDVRSHDRLLRVALERAREDLALRRNTRSVAIAHAFVTGGEGCDSERALSVGGSSEVGLAAFKGFDYAALGHLHGRQSLGKGAARYSGSPLAYSFSERRHTKGVWLVDIPTVGDVTVTAVDLPVHRRLAVVEGELAQLLSDRRWQHAEDAFVSAVLTDAVFPLNAMERLRVRFPHAVQVSAQPRIEVGGRPTYAERVKGRTDLELACDFVEHLCGEAPSDEDACILASAIDGVLSPGEESAA